jgi:mono/diheme cytochrome c family protein
MSGLLPLRSVGVLALLSLTGCDAVIRWRDDPLQDQASIQPHEPPLESVPAGVVPTIHRGGGLRVMADIEPARSMEEAKTLRNPFRPTAAVIAAGKIGYDRYCSHCHGDMGYGWTSVGSSLDPRPPDIAKVVAGRTDGEIFGVITFGIGQQLRVPLALGATVSIADRWRIIHYVRTLPTVRRGKAPRWDQQILRE